MEKILVDLPEVCSLSLLFYYSSCYLLSFTFQLIGVYSPLIEALDDNLDEAPNEATEMTTKSNELEPYIQPLEIA